MPILRAFKISDHSPEKQRYYLSLDDRSMIKALNEGAGEKSTAKWQDLHSSDFQTAKESDEQDRPGREATAAWALICFNMTVFENKKPKRKNNEQKCEEEENILQKAFNN